VQGNVIEVDKVPYGTRDAMKRNPVVLYTATSCDAYCAQARSLLTKRGVPFTEKVVDRDEKLLNELKRVSSDTSVPFLLVGTSPVKGFDDPQWQSALDGGGYPRVNANVGEIKPTVIDKADEPAKSKADGAADAKTDGKSATKTTPAATATK
jgi:glutaredoxin